jgi:alpha-galactosidase
LREGIRSAAGPGHWNDYDMLEVGNGMGDAEDRSHFAMWCMLASPLMMGNDLRSATKETIKTLTNKEVIAVNQDPLGIQGFRLSDEHGVEVWAKPLVGGDWAMTFINMNDEPYKLEHDWDKHPLHDDLVGRRLEVENTVYRIRDLFNHKDLGDTKKPLKSKIEVHDVLMIRLSPK